MPKPPAPWLLTMRLAMRRFAVPDIRLEKIAAIAKSKEIIPTRISFVDIAGLVRGAAGDHDAAEELHRRALSIRREMLGVDHPDVAQSLNGLASALAGKGLYREAEESYRAALAIAERALAMTPDAHLRLKLTHVAALSACKLRDVKRARRYYAQSSSGAQPGIRQTCLRGWPGCPRSCACRPCGWCRWPSIQPCRRWP